MLDRFVNKRTVLVLILTSMAVATGQAATDAEVASIIRNTPISGEGAFFESQGYWDYLPLSGRGMDQDIWDSWQEEAQRRREAFEATRGFPNLIRSAEDLLNPKIVIPMIRNFEAHGTRSAIKGTSEYALLNANDASPLWQVEVDLIKQMGFGRTGDLDQRDEKQRIRMAEALRTLAERLEVPYTNARTFREFTIDNWDRFNTRLADAVQESLLAVASGLKMSKNNLAIFKVLEEIHTLSSSSFSKSIEGRIASIVAAKVRIHNFQDIITVLAKMDTDALHSLFKKVIPNPQGESDLRQIEMLATYTMGLGYQRTSSLVQSGWTVGKSALRMNTLLNLYLISKKITREQFITLRMGTTKPETGKSIFSQMLSMTEGEQSSFVQRARDLHLGGKLLAPPTRIVSLKESLKSGRSPQLCRRALR